MSKVYDFRTGKETDAENFGNFREWLNKTLENVPEKVTSAIMLIESDDGFVEYRFDICSRDAIYFAELIKVHALMGD
jgi:hypothetical protein